jgi:hypothetical protein
VHFGGHCASAPVERTGIAAIAVTAIMAASTNFLVVLIVSTSLLSKCHLLGHLSGHCANAPVVKTGSAAATAKVTINASMHFLIKLIIFPSFEVPVAESRPEFGKH